MTTTDLDLPVVLPRGAECAECVEEFGDGLRHLRGVRDVTADVPRGLLHVSFDNQLLAYDDLTRDARRIGAAAHCAAHCPRDGQDQCECQLAVDPGAGDRYEQRLAHVTGLDCADCALKLEGALQHTDGVVSATTSFGAATLKVVFDPQEIAFDQVLEGVRALREDWRTRADHRHPLLAPGDIVPVLIGGGTWIVTYPHSCSLTCDITYLPGHVDEAGTGRRVEDEVARRLQAAVAADPWFTDHPLRIQWSDDVVPAEIPGDHPLVELALEVAHTFGHAGRVAGLDSWHDAASFTRGGTPCFSFGPDGIGSAHAVDECVTIDALVDFCAATAVTAMRWCGVAP